MKTFRQWFSIKEQQTNIPKYEQRQNCVEVVTLYGDRLGLAKYLAHALGAQMHRVTSKPYKTPVDLV